VLKSVIPVSHMLAAKIDLCHQRHVLVKVTVAVRVTMDATAFW